MSNVVKGHKLLAAAVAGVLSGTVTAMAAAAPARTPSMQAADLAVSSDAELLALRALSDGSLIAVGPVEALSVDESSIQILGQTFVVLADPDAQLLLRSLSLGDVVALFGDHTNEGLLVHSGSRLSGQYVPGASRVYLKGRLTQLSSFVGRAAVGRLELDLSSAGIDSQHNLETADDTVEIVGTQPLPGGVVLVSSIEVTRDRSTDASVGTGRSTDASVGTGRSTDASVGTGRSTDASVGTGRSTDASVGTGRSTDASVGTGRSTDASVGTG
jgi:hypothetical protein